MVRRIGEKCKEGITLTTLFGGAILMILTAVVKSFSVGDNTLLVGVFATGAAMVVVGFALARVWRWV